MPNLGKGYGFGRINEINFMHIPSKDRAICINVPFSAGSSNNTSFIIDTGSVISLIKAKLLIQSVYMNLSERIILNGIAKTKMCTVLFLVSSL